MHTGSKKRRFSGLSFNCLSHLHVQLQRKEGKKFLEQLISRCHSSYFTHVKFLSFGFSPCCGPTSLTSTSLLFSEAPLHRLCVCLGFCVWSYSNSLDPESLSLCLSRISVIPPELIHTTTHRCITAFAVNLWCMSVEQILISCLTLVPSIMEYTKGAMKCVKYVSLF